MVTYSFQGGWGIEYLAEWKKSIIPDIVHLSWIIYLELNMKSGFG